MRLFLDLLLPPACAGCGREGHVLCRPCAGGLQRRLTEPAGAPIGLPMLLPDGLVELEWCAAFSGPVRAALHALKYDGHRRVVEPLASALAERWQRAAMGGDVLTWVPVHRLRRRERGFDQAEDLCRALAARIGLPAEALLARRQRTVAQHALGRTARAGNVGGAFEVPPGKVASVAGRWVLVVDDVTTTGSTLAGCARALLGAGALAVSGLAVARER